MLRHLAFAVLGAAVFWLATISFCAAQEKTIIAFGDSLTAGYGLPDSDSFPSQLERALNKKGYDVRVINAGVSGDTTAGGLERIDWVMQDPADLVILALGANDALRGIDPKSTRKNLDQIIRKIKATGTPVLLAGMKAPPNLGLVFAGGYNNIYTDLADKYDLPLYPFFLDGVIAQPMLNQRDGIHPNADGVAVVVGNILPEVIDALDAAD